MAAHWLRVHSLRRLIIAVLVCVPAICFATGVGAGPAAAATDVSSNITSSTTWTTAGSPYVLETNVTVESGVTLTVNPGVTVEFNGGPYTSLFIDGTIKSVGTSAKPITFTSAQGAAGSGAPGQYEAVNVQAGTSSQFSYTNFYYGGNGSGGYYAYGALEADNAGTQVSISHSVFEYNEYSGLQIGSNVVATVTYSTFEHNGNGISQVVSASPGKLTLSDSTVSNNVHDGLFFNVTNSPTGSSVTSNLITANGSNGIEIDTYCSTPTASWPHGSQNDIYANGDTSDPSDGTELYTLEVCDAISVNWTGNYWGDVTWYTGPTAYGDETSCQPPEPAEWFVSASYQPEGYLGYSDWTNTDEPPPGAISTSNYATFSSCEDGLLAFENVYNSIFLQPGQISTSYIRIP